MGKIKLMTGRSFMAESRSLGSGFQRQLTIKQTLESDKSAANYDPEQPLTDHIIQLFSR
jgi:hypothetical protein